MVVNICRDCRRPINDYRPYTISWHLHNGCGEVIDDDND